MGEAHLSDDTKEKIRAMLRQIGELESVGDSCFNLARILRRKRATKIVFTPEMDEGIRRMFALVEEALTRMNTVLSGHKEDFGIAVSEDLERRINACRNELKRQNIENLDAAASRWTPTPRRSAWTERSFPLPRPNTSS